MIGQNARRDGPSGAGSGHGGLWWFASLFMFLVLVLAGCDHSVARSPTFPTPTSTSAMPQPAPQPVAPSDLVWFVDSASGFRTTDLRDAEDEIVQFNAAGELVWTADGQHIPGFGVRQGISIAAERVCACWFEVRFGTLDGERRAYLTADYGHDNPGSVVDIEIAAGVVVVGRTDVYPPGTYTLSGVISESTAAGSVPIEGAHVWRGYATGWVGATTNHAGLYEIRGLYDRTDEVVVTKEGYATDTRHLSISGDTRLDFQLVKQ